MVPISPEASFAIVKLPRILGARRALHWPVAGQPKPNRSE